MTYRLRLELKIYAHNFYFKIMKPVHSILSAAPALSNKRIVQFFINLFILFSIWFVAYALILRPPRILDRPLTNFITNAVVGCFNVLSPAAQTITWKEIPGGSGAELVQNGKSVFGIWDVCNGIDLMFIYVGILVLLPYPLKRKIIFSIGGIIVIIIANIFRVTALYFINIYQQSAFYFSHHYVFTILMYILIFYGWLLFIKTTKTNAKSS